MSTQQPSAVPWWWGGGGSSISGAGSGGGGGSAFAGRIQTDGVAGEVLVAGNVCRLADAGGATAGQVFRADGTSANARVVGIALAGAGIGAAVTYVSAGAVGVLFGAAPVAADNGKTVYLDTGVTPGRGTITLPVSGTLVRLGYLTGADGATTTPTVVLSIQLIAVIS